jgi:trypsin-like peptidase
MTSPGPKALLRVTTLLRAVLPLGMALSLTLHATEPEPPADPRRVYSSDAPDWLRAVGKLQVPGSRYEDGRRAHYREDCSATLVARHAGNSADTIVTAWHCLEFYNDLSKPILFTLPPGPGQGIDREVYRLADGGGMHADWAILRLYQPIPAQLVTAMTIHPSHADPGQPISMAGYSRDAGLGNNGKALTFDPDCLITRQTEAECDSDCVAHKGASGGAVVQLSAQGKPRFSGVISQGDGSSLSTFIPVAGFRSALNQHLK